ncbi:MAG: MinD/ParA family protein [Desulfobacteraceae bacterium]|nr:MAG: MinD/ParA family protein [Desulfobacteraceae bacterium]
MAEILPIGGGKGGVGKSFISANLAALLARRGRRVVLLDLDLGGSNLHTFLGIRTPRDGINSFLNKNINSLELAAVPTQISNLAFISSVHCPIDIANLWHAQKAKLINAIRRLPFDYVLLDIGAGTHFNTLDFYLTAEKGIIVCAPEPTSIENAFRFIKAAYLRKIKLIIKQHAFHPKVKDAVVDAAQQQLGAAEIFDIVVRYDPGREMLLRESISRFQFKFVLNQVRKNGDPLLGEKMKNVCNRHFSSQFHFLGNIAYDERVSDSIVSKTLFTVQYPDAAASADLAAIAGQLNQKKSVSQRLCEVP